MKLVAVSSAQEQLDNPYQTDQHPRGAPTALAVTSMLRNVTAATTQP